MNDDIAVVITISLSNKLLDFNFDSTLRTEVSVTSFLVKILKENNLWICAIVLQGFQIIKFYIPES